MRNTFIVALFAVAFAACSDDEGPIVPVDNTGVVAGVAYIDRDGDGRLNPAVDATAAGVMTALLLEGTNDTIARATSRADGSFVMPRVQPGRYRLVATRGTVLGDTVNVLGVDSAQITLTARDTIVRHVRLGYPLFTVAAMKTLPAGRRITLEGIALNGWVTFGDSTIHLHDATGTVRAVRVAQSTVQAGDSVRMIGTTGLEGGRVVLAGVLPHILAAARGLPPLDSLSTARAASADGGRLVDGQARIAAALVLDTATVGEFRRVGVNDGTGRLELLLSRSKAFPTEAYSPGALVSAHGVLVPALTGGTWQLKPRNAADVTATFTTVTTAGARTATPGTRVFIHGIALNAWNTFGDATVHVADATGAVRAIRVQQSTVNAGDSIRILGTIGLSSGRMALADAVVNVLSPARGLPSIPLVATGAAATAANGARADNQVRITNALIVDSTTVAGDRIIGVNDGSGRLEVVLDQSVAFNPGPYAPGGTFAGAGVLVPAPTGSAWRLKPRDRDEAVVTYPTATIAQARGLPVGRQIVLQGLALSAPAAFGDSTVHLRDATGTIRAIRVTGTFAAGDSVRLLGATDTRSGQPVLSVVSSTVVRAGAGVAEPDSMSTNVAATAASGSRDADFVRIGGEIVGAVAQGGGTLLTVNDGSGSIEVFLSPQVQVAGVLYVPGALIRAAGVLVPTTGGRWQLKPRNAGDVSVRFQTATVSQARQLTDGRIVYISAVALNSWVTFGDRSLHITDRQRAIRVIDLDNGAFIFAGDSVGVLARKTTRLGQPVLIGLGASVLLSGVGVPAPVHYSAGTAATAVGGTRDADHVSTTGTIVQIATGPDAGDLILGISDGHGVLEVLLDADAGFPTGLYQLAQSVTVTGLLVPAPSGTSWRLKPRSPDEIRIQ
jgi:hypothetical protein